MRRAAFALLLLLPLAVQAKGPGLEPLPDIPPPPGMVVDPALEPQVTVRSQNGEQVEEFRVKGRLYMLKVTPAHGNPYFMIDQHGDGNLIRRDEQQAPLLAPLWSIHAF